MMGYYIHYVLYILVIIMIPGVLGLSCSVFPDSLLVLFALFRLSLMGVSPLQWLV